MKLEIKKIEENKYIVKYGRDNELDISIESENWNSEGINKFLIKLATTTVDENRIELDFDEQEYEKNKVYNHIVELFREFANEYNKLLENKNINI